MAKKSNRIIDDEENDLEDAEKMDTEEDEQEEGFEQVADSSPEKKENKSKNKSAPEEKLEGEASEEEKEEREEKSGKQSKNKQAEKKQWFESKKSLKKELRKQLAKIFDRAQVTTACHAKQLQKIRELQERCCAASEVGGTELSASELFLKIFMEMVQRILVVYENDSSVNRIVEFIVSQTADRSASRYRRLKKNPANFLSPSLLTLLRPC